MATANSENGWSGRRLLKIYLISLALAPVFIFGMFIWVKSIQDGPSPPPPPLQTRIFFGIVVWIIYSVVIFIITLLGRYALILIRQFLEITVPPSDPNTTGSSRPVAAVPPGFPVVTVIPEYPSSDEGSGNYKVDGVDKQTQMDATLHIWANSAANAKVKAELEGVIVTSVAKI